MTATLTDPNRTHWEAAARGEPTDWGSLATEPAGVTRRRVGSPGGLWLRPPGPLAHVAVLAIHGGGFVSGSVATHRRMLGHLARASGVSVFAAEYGLVPAAVFPSQVDTVLRAYRWLLDGRATRVAVLGDSCGALLALDLAMLARDLGLPRPAGLLLMSAWTDLHAAGGSYAGGTDPFFTRAAVRDLGAAYLAGADPRDPLASPLTADLRALPPTYLQVGADESLLDDSRSLAARLHNAGVKVHLEEFPGQLHTFQMAAGRSDVADRAIGKAGTWLRSALI